MTTITELGRMLIEVGENGRVLQRLRLSPMDGAWEDFAGQEHKHINEIDLGDYEYRLKPKVTYYRVWREAGGGVRIQEQAHKILDWVDWSPRPTDVHIHDFEIES